MQRTVDKNDLVTFSAQLQDGDYFCMGIGMRFPVFMDARDMVDMARNEMLRTFRGVVVEEQKTLVAGRPAHRFRAQVGDGIGYLDVVIITWRREVMAFAGGGRGKPDPASRAAEFLNSVTSRVPLDPELKYAPARKKTARPGR